MRPSLTDVLPLPVTFFGNALEIFSNKVPEARLFCQIALNGSECLRVTVEPELRIVVFGEIPQAAVYDLLCQFNREIAGGTPAGWAWGEYVDV